MFKALKRQGQKKINFEINVKLVKVGASEIPRDITLQVVWKRGPETANSPKVDLNEYEPDSDMDHLFQKVSSFYSTDNQMTWEKKTCDFMINIIEHGASELHAKKEIDMAQFVNHNDSPQTIEFDSDQFPGLFIKVEWTIKESGDTKRVSNVGGSGLSSGVEDMIEQAREMEERNEILHSEIDAAFKDKQAIEKLISAEKKIRKELEGGIISSGSMV